MHSDDVFQPVLCCEDGRCRTEDCARLVPEGDLAQDDEGGLSRLGPPDTIECPGVGASETRAVLRADTFSRWMKPAVWPTVPSEPIWWRGNVRYQDSSLLTQEERTELVAAGSVVVDAHVDIATVDLDGDELAEQLVTIDERGGGVFLRRKEGDGPALIPLLRTVSPLLVGAIDLDGDGVREVLVLDTSMVPFDLVVLDTIARAERLRTKWYCKARPRHSDPGPYGETE